MSTEKKRQIKKDIQEKTFRNIQNLSKDNTKPNKETEKNRNMC